MGRHVILKTVAFRSLLKRAHVPTQRVVRVCKQVIFNHHSLDVCHSGMFCSLETDRTEA